MTPQGACTVVCHANQPASLTVKKPEEERHVQNARHRQIQAVDTAAPSSRASQGGRFRPFVSRCMNEQPDATIASQNKMQGKTFLASILAQLQ